MIRLSDHINLPVRKCPINCSFFVRKGPDQANYRQKHKFNQQVIFNNVGNSRIKFKDGKTAKQFNRTRQKFDAVNLYTCGWSKAKPHELIPQWYYLCYTYFQILHHRGRNREIINNTERHLLVEQIYIHTYYEARRLQERNNLHVDEDLLNKCVESEAEDEVYLVFLWTLNSIEDEKLDYWIQPLYVNCFISMI